MNRVVLPFIAGSVNTKLQSLVFDLSGNIIFSTSHLKLVLCGKNQEIIGKTIHNLENLSLVPSHILQQLEKLRIQIITTETTLRYCVFINNSKLSIAYNIVHAPIFYHDGTVCGSRAIVTNFSWFGYKEYFSAILRPYRRDNKIIRRMNIKLKITPKQHITLFLLSCGFSQNEIATIIEVTRGTVASNIASLCKKFGLNQQNTPLLIKKFNELKIGNTPPKSLLESKIIVLK